MYTNILVPLDGSPLAEAALPFARGLGRRTGATLTLVQAAQYSALLADSAVDQMKAVESAEAYVGRLTSELKAEGFEVASGVPFGGSTAEWIVNESVFRHADMIIMATHGRVGLDRWIRGSVAEAVVHRSATPVMLVRTTDAQQFAERFLAPEPVLVVPLDGSELAEAALPVALDMSRALGARAVLIGVIPKAGQLVAAPGAVTTYAGLQHAQLEAEARAYLNQVAQRLGPGVETVIRRGDASREIASAAQESCAAAVVMATHGRSGLVRSVLGSVAGDVLHRTEVPVVLVHTPAARVAEEPAVTAAWAAPADD